MTTTVATATREGTGGRSADAASIHHSAYGSTSAALIDGIGHSDTIADAMHHLAWVAARMTARRGPLAGILTAGELIADDGAGDEAEPDGVAVAVRVDPGVDAVVAWVGDCRAWGWDGRELRQYTTDQTVGEQLRAHGGASAALAAAHDDWLKASLSRAVVALVPEVTIPDPLIILTTDGVHDALTPDRLAQLVAEFTDDAQALADALVAAVEPDAVGVRDDATVVVLDRRTPPAA